MGRLATTKWMDIRWGGAVAGVVASVVLPAGTAAQEPAGSDPMRVVVLGTGTPNADPDRSGPALAVVAGGRSFLVDAGPGVVRRAAAAAARHGIDALGPTGLERVFITHLHSDHTVGLPDLIFSPWVLDRVGPLHVTGPPGTEEMVGHIQSAWRADVDMRLYGLEPREANPDAYRSPVVETTGGTVYDEGGVRVDAVPVEHGSWPHALGYRFESGGRVIVISGDARPSESLVEACDGCDLLVHEVYSVRGFETRPPEWQTYHASSHTSAEELAELATRAGARALVLYHQLFWGVSDDELLAEVRAAGYQGTVSSASDLDVY